MEIFNWPSDEIVIENVTLWLAQLGNEVKRGKCLLLSFSVYFSFLGHVVVNMVIFSRHIFYGGKSLASNLCWLW